LLKLSLLRNYECGFYHTRIIYLSPIGDKKPSPLGDRESILSYMKEYKRGSHSVWDLNYHIVWVTKYRHPILSGDVGVRCRELLREIARSQEMSIKAGAINRDHVHLLLIIPP
jgi:Transposase IS200 like